MRTAGIQLQLQNASRWITAQRIRSQAIVLAAGIWLVVLADYSVAGTKDYAGNLKFEDFLPIYMAGGEVAHGKLGSVYDPQVVMAQAQSLMGPGASRIAVPMMYGPQIALLASPLSRFSFLTAAALWTVLSALLYFVSCYLIWKICARLHPYAATIILLCAAFPPFFNFVLRGQSSGLLLACVVTAFYAFVRRQEWLAGLFLGSLIIKPPLLLGIIVVFIAARSWKTMAGVITAIVLQLGLTWLHFGTSIMGRYASLFWNLGQLVTNTEVGTAYVQMHCLRSFWRLLIPQVELAEAFYVVSSIVVVIWAVQCWKSNGPLQLRFSALILATILVDPHLFVYDLIALAPVLLLVANWMLSNFDDSYPKAVELRVTLYLVYLLPLFSPLAYWTHLQLSVLAMLFLQWLLWRILREPWGVMVSNAPSSEALLGFPACPTALP